MKKANFATSVLALAMSSTFAQAEDRSGFFLAGGIGLGTNTMEATDTYNGYSESVSGNGGMITSLKVGGHINPNFALYYQNEVSYFNDSYNYGYTAGMTGIGGTYYFDQSGGFFLEGGLGLGVFVRDDGWIQGSGGGALVGFGTEVNDNLEVGLVFMSTSTNDPYWEGVEFGTKTFGAKLTLKL